MHLGTERQWDALAERLADPEHWPLGLDTETYGQPDGHSPQFTARVHCWSLGVLTPRRSPRGYRSAVGVYLPARALVHGPLRRLLEDPLVPKWAHNAPHDFHALRNVGVEVRGVRDTLQWARVALPDLPCGYGLKPLEVHVLGKPPRPGFKDVVALEYQDVTTRRKVERGCVCGGRPCRARASSDWLDASVPEWRPHTRVTWRRFVPQRVTRTRLRTADEMVEGCPGWDAWVQYAIADAVGVLELWDYLRQLRGHSREVHPWD